MSATDYLVFEVFHQKRPGDAFVHVGEVEAPDATTAMLFAKEHFLRREPAVGLWVVDRRDVHVADWPLDVLANGREKNYRRTLGRDARADVFARERAERPRAGSESPA